MAMVGRVKYDPAPISVLTLAFYSFFSNLSLINSGFALFGMFFVRWFMAEKSIIYVVGFLTIVGGCSACLLRDSILPSTDGHLL